MASPSLPSPSASPSPVAGVSVPHWLRALDRALLVVPAVSGGATGLGLLLLPGNRFVGAGAFAAALGLTLGLRTGEWRAVRLPAVAALAMNTGTAVACCEALASGTATSWVYLALLIAVAPGASASLVLALRHRPLQPQPQPDAGPWTLAPLMVQAALAGVLGLPSLLGYGFMALGGLRCRQQAELRIPALMVLVLCSQCALVSVISLVIGERSALGYLVAVLAPLMAGATAAQLRAMGRSKCESGRLAANDRWRRSGTLGCVGAWMRGCLDAWVLGCVGAGRETALLALRQSLRHAHALVTSGCVPDMLHPAPRPAISAVAKAGTSRSHCARVRSCRPMPAILLHFANAP